MCQELKNEQICGSTHLLVGIICWNLIVLYSYIFLLFSFYQTGSPTFLSSFLKSTTEIELLSHFVSHLCDIPHFW